MPRTLVAVLLVLAALPATAAAADRAAEPSFLPGRTLLAQSLGTATSFKGACHTAYRPGHAGIATSDVRVSSGGAVGVRLDGTKGDWDVAVFDAAGRLVAADASPDAQEAANGYVLTGGQLHVQACRRSGATRRPGEAHVRARQRRQPPPRRRPTRRRWSTCSPPRAPPRRS